MSDVELVLYTNPMSRGRIVRWMLEEIGAPYDTHVIAYGPEMRGPDYRSINPMAKVPAIRHNGVVVTECAAICAYLADAFPDAGLAPPANAPERAPYYRWMFFTAGPLEAAVVNKALGVEVPPDKQGMVGYGSIERAIDAIETAIEDGGPYLCGSRFTTADLYVGSHVAWAMQFGLIDRRPTFDNYVSLVTSRPAAARAREIDDELRAEAKKAG
jgi:glutathione S-transferase